MVFPSLGLIIGSHYVLRYDRWHVYYYYYYYILNIVYYAFISENILFVLRRKSDNFKLNPNITELVSTASF